MVVEEVVVSVWLCLQEGETGWGGCAEEDDLFSTRCCGVVDELCGVQADGGGGAVDEDLEWFRGVSCGGRLDWGG